MGRGRGGTGLVTPQRDDEGMWHVRRDIELGANIVGYEDVGHGT